MARKRAAARRALSDVEVAEIRAWAQASNEDPNLLWQGGLGLGPTTSPEPYVRDDELRWWSCLVCRGTFCCYGWLADQHGRWRVCRHGAGLFWYERECSWPAPAT